MFPKLVAGLTLAGLLVLTQACGGDGGGGISNASVSRPGSIPTATPPANPPPPIVLGQSPATTGAPTGATGGGGVYVIKSGDTLDAIAAQAGVPPEQRAAWISEVLRLNGIADARLLSVGQELSLPRTPAAVATRPAGTTPVVGTPAGAPTAAPTPFVPATTATVASGTATPRPTASSAGGTYTVVSGDEPLIIAGKLGVPAAQRVAWAAELVSINNINPNAMVVGQVLRLPASTP
jgi:LysM repeat protein